MKDLTFSLIALVLLSISTCFADTISEITPAHSRPYLLPETLRQTLLEQIENQSWARQEIELLQQQAREGDGYIAAFLYALTKEQEFLVIARNWLLEIGRNGGGLGKSRAGISDDFFNQGMPWLGDVYYNTDTRHIEAYDYVYKGLTESDKAIIESGLFASAGFRKKAMDTWWQTPNLVFKPTTMVAITGLLTQNREFIDWGFFRKPDSSLGGYFPVLNNMLKDNGPWNEAPIYAINHLPLSMSLKMSDYLSRLTGRNWFQRLQASDSSVGGLMDYYVNTSYPGETRPDGSRVYRLLTYGDGATSPHGDTFLLSGNPYQRNLGPELTQAWNVSRKPEYAALLKLGGAYQPSLIDRPALPQSPLLPAAKSSIWPDFGLAFLRSDQTAGYWSNPDAMATSLLLRQGYGHGHADALSMTLFGAGKLFYPDYNPVQYQNPAEGWTSSSIAHNTVVVDGGNSSIPESVRTIHDFKNGHSVIQASVIEPRGLYKQRTLAITKEYLLDVFHLNSLTPRTFDYILHSFARINPDTAMDFYMASQFGPRYQKIREIQSLTLDTDWSLDFVYDLDAENRRSETIIENMVSKTRSRDELDQGFGRGTIDAFRSSIVNMKMTAEQHTRIGHGIGPYGLAFLIARRENRNNTTFVSTHTPFYGGQTAPVREIKVLAENSYGSLIQVMTDQHMDIHAVGHVDDEVSLGESGSGISVRFTAYGFIRINTDTGEYTSKGNWGGFRVSSAVSGLDNDLVQGDDITSPVNPESARIPPLQVNSYPELAILTDFSTTGLTLSLTNLGDRPLSAVVKLDDSSGFALSRQEYRFQGILPYQSASQIITLGRYDKASGIDILPVTITAKGYSTPIRHGVKISIGPGLEENYSGTGEPVYRVHSFSTEFDLGMRAGFLNRLANRTGEVLFAGSSLFGLSDGTDTYSPEAGNINTSYTWPNRQQASVIAEINNLIRWHTLFIQDRAYIKLDPAYTRSNTVHVVFDRKNPGFDWSRASYLEGGKSTPLPEPNGQDLSTRAIEIPLGSSGQSLCITAQGERAWENSQDALLLPVSREHDQWSLGVCEAGTLEDWVR